MTAHHATTATTATMSNIEKQMAKHINACHQLAKRRIKAARKAIAKAVDAAIEVGELLGKVQSHHKGGVHDWACTNTKMDGLESRAYLSAQYTASKRDAAQDKRCLQLLGVLTKSPPRKPAKTKKQKPSAATVASKATASILSALENRSIEEMTPGERAVLKMNLEGVARIFVDLSE